ncbi:MAG: hypothetical protein KDB61_03875 [Planctomycetes bacterium]|nr:hypothetical protein [Planctomycetota bacterium]
MSRLTLLAFALFLVASAAFAQRSGKNGYMGPPPPPPYNPEELARWADVGPAKLAKALHLASLGNVEGALAGLDAALEGADEGLAARLNQEKQRLIEFGAAREAWFKELFSKKKKIRLPIDGKMAAFAIKSIENGVLTFTKERDGVKDWAISALSPEIMQTNLGRKIKDAGPAWLEFYVAALAQQEWDASKAEGLDPNDVKQLEQYPWLLKLGSLVDEILDLSKAGYPESEEELFALVDRVGAVYATQKDIPPLDGIATDLRAYADDLAKRAFATASLTKLLRGKVTDLGEGRWKFVYEFDSPEEASDFINDDELFKYCIPEAETEATADKSGWLHHEGALAWAGRVGLYHHVPLEGAMVARYEWSATAIGNTFDIQGGNLIFGLCAAPKELSFIGNAFLHTVWCYAKGQLVNNSNGPVPIYQKRVYKCELARDAAGTVTGTTDGKVVGSLSLPAVESGPFFLAANLNIRGRLERLELEGQVPLDRLDYLRRLRAWEYLDRLGLAGSPPSMDAE